MKFTAESAESAERKKIGPGGLGNLPYGMLRDMQAQDRHGEIAASRLVGTRNDMEAVEYFTSLYCGFLI